MPKGSSNTLSIAIVGFRRYPFVNETADKSQSSAVALVLFEGSRSWLRDASTRNAFSAGPDINLQVQVTINYRANPFLVFYRCFIELYNPDLFYFSNIFSIIPQVLGRHGESCT